MRYGMLIELDRCIGCQACVTACKETWNAGRAARRDWVRTCESGSRADGLQLTFYPGLCMQCEDTPCVRACPAGATFTDAAGRVVVDDELCIGCGSCVPACPYDARVVDAESGVVAKCDLCAPRVDAGLEPACVTTCPAECRIFGDLDAAGSPLTAAIARTGARPLETAQVRQKPKVYYSGDRERERLLAAGVVGSVGQSEVMEFRRAVMTPVARLAVPLAAAGALLGGLLADSIARRRRVAHEDSDATLTRHDAPMRWLHWFNAACWILLLTTGLGAMVRVHVLSGLAWAAAATFTLLVWKRGGRDLLGELRMTRDDARWLLLKPLALAGLLSSPLPRQDKYNAGQKLFAMAVLALTGTIVLSGLSMSFHIGPVALAFTVHGAAVALMLAGLAVHLTMALVLSEERPALRSMFTGRVSRAHAVAHSARWVEEVEK